MEDDPEDEVLVHLVHFNLDIETVSHYQRRAEAAGRTLEEQLRYEVKAGHGLAVPDPSDSEATQRG